MPDPDRPEWWTPDLDAWAWVHLTLARMGRDAYRARPGPPWERGCARCHGPLAGKRADARYCSHACRQAVYRARRAGRIPDEAELVAWLRARQLAGPAVP